MTQLEKQNQSMADEIKRLKAVIIKHENRIRQIEGPQREVASGSGDANAAPRPPSSDYHHSNNSSDMAPDEV
jgi:hypothetical protein